MYKDYDIAECNESWSLALDKKELALLRFMYWTRSQRDIMERFKGEMEETEINLIIDRHLKLGTIMPYKQFYLCIANDPEYLWLQQVRRSREGTRAKVADIRQAQIKIA